MLSSSVADGSSTGTLTVAITDDALLEATETIDAGISNSSFGAVSIGTSSATANIVDNDTATADLSVTTDGDEAGPTDAVFTVTLDTVNNTGAPITFDLIDLSSGSATSGDDYTAISGSAVVSVADGSSTGTLTVAITDDALLEATETIDAGISNSSFGAVSIGTSSATANIVDNDTATADLSVTTDGDEAGPTDAVFTVTLDTVNNTGAPITFDLDDLGTGSATPGDDYTAISGSAVISVADGASTGTLTVLITDDALLESTETIDAEISNSSNGVVSISGASASASIASDDTAVASLSVTTDGDEEGPVDAVFTVTLSSVNNTDAPITFDFADAGTGSATSGADYTAIAGSAVISVPTGSDTGTISVGVIDDAVFDPAETIDGEISNSSSGSVIIYMNAGTASITDNEAVIGDLVFIDINGDGDQTGDAGLPGVTVNLFDSTGTNQLDTTTTGAGGDYSFSVTPGAYVVEFVAPSNANFSPQNNVADSLDSDADPTTGRTGQITVVAGQTEDTVDAGFRDFAPMLSFANVVSLEEHTDTTNGNVKVADVVIDDFDGGPNVLSLGGGADDTSFLLIGTELFIRAQTVLDFETQASYTTVISVDDPTIAPSPNDSRTFTLDLVNINEPPVVQASNRVTQVLESNALNQSLRVADITVIDDGLGTATLGLTGTHASEFELQGAELHLKQGTPLDFETTPFLFVTVGADDASLPGSPDGSVDLVITVLNVFEPPEVDASVNGTEIPNNGVINFGDHEQAGIAPQRVIVFENNGFEDLILQPAAVPAGFSVVGANFAAGTAVAPGDSVSLTVEMDTTSIGVATGVLSVANNDMNESLYQITLSGAVLQGTTNPTVVPEGLIIDNGDTGSFESGVWLPVAGFGFEADAVVSIGGIGERAAWVYSGLTPGQFDVSMTWLNGSDRSDSVPIIVRDGIGGPILSSITLNQRIRPDGPKIGGRNFGVLDRVNLTSDTLVVELANPGTGGAVIADAVMITPFVPPPNAPEIALQLDGRGLVDGDSFSLSGLTAGASGSKTVLVRNEGTADLVVQPVSVTGAAFSVGANFAPNTVIPAGGEASFGLIVDTSATGVFNGTLTLGNNDADEAPFDVSLNATVRDPGAQVVIVDDGDPDFVFDGDWLNVPGYGFDHDARVLTQKVAATATWTFSGLAAGDYNVSATWLNGSDRWNAVPFVIRDGAAGPVLSTLSVDQTKAPSGGDSQGGRPFSDFGVVTIAGDTLVVEVDNTGATRPVIADAIRIERTTPPASDPEITVTQGVLTVLDDSQVSFGSAEENGVALSRTFTVTNSGTADLVLEPITISGQGFQLTSANFVPGQVVAPAASVDFTVELPTNTIDDYFASLEFATNDADENPFNIDLSGSVNPPAQAGVRVVDNGDSGFSATPGFSPVNGYGFGQDALAGNGSNGAESATWTFDGLSPGSTHSVGTTWLRGGDRDSNVSYVIRDGVGGAVLGTVTVDQKQNPAADVTEGGRPFQTLGQFTTTSGTLVVELSTAGSSLAVIADAVRLQELP